MRHTWCVPFTIMALACGGDGATSNPPPDPNTIGVAGGEIRSGDGVAVLTIPRGALTRPTLVTLVAAAALPLDAAQVGSGYEVQPAGTTFAVPATISLAVSDANVQIAGCPLPEGPCRVHSGRNSLRAPPEKRF